MPRLRQLTVALVTTLALVAACAAHEPGEQDALTPAASRPSASVPGSPIAGRKLFVDPTSWAAWAVRKYPAEAAQLEKIADVPQARWLTPDTGITKIAGYVNTYTTVAAKASAMPVFVLYAIPERDCDQYSAGGFTTATQYEAWVNGIAKGIAGRRVITIIEPDALAHMDASNANTGKKCLTSSQRTARYAMIRYAVDKLSAGARTSVYIDGGGMSASVVAQRLAKVDVKRARGFALNVSGFDAVSDQVGFGEQVSKLLRTTYKTGVKYYVIDTSRDGNGAPLASGIDAWCNPPGRALGHTPTSRTTGAHADGYLWIKRPGESDGDCNRGDPESGLWFESYALSLIANAESR